MASFRFLLNGRAVVADADPDTTLLDWLRGHGLPGTKEGCAEGDCGACSVALRDPAAPSGPWRAVCGCLLLLPMVDGAEVRTVEGIADDGLHPAQDALVRHLGSQCGYCTPGFVITLFEAAHRHDLDEPWKLDDQLCGNLCRCTGYRPIRDAAQEIAGCRAVADGAAAGPTAAVCRTPGLADPRMVPRTLLDALQVRADRPQAVVVAGGTDVALRVTRRFERLPDLLVLGAVPELRGIEVAAERVRVGAATPLADLETAARGVLPAVERMLRYFGSRQIKNRGTVGGNLCNASPIGDLAPVLLAHDAALVLGSVRGERRLSLSEFFVGYRQTALAPDELLLAVEIPRTGPDERIVAYKVSKRRELDISTVAAGLWVRLDGGRVAAARFAFGGMAATPARAAAAESAVLGRIWSAETAEVAASALDFEPLDDLRGSAWYRRTVAANLLRAFYEDTSVDPAPRLPADAAGPFGVG